MGSLKPMHTTSYAMAYNVVCDMVQRTYDESATSYVMTYNVTRRRIHLKSVEAGYLDIFLEYSTYMTTNSICLGYSNIYLEYANPFPIPGVCLEYA